MTKRILLWGAPTKCDETLPFEESFKQSGNNYGNILIGSAVQSFLSENELISRSDLKSPEEANERCDHVVIPAANFLWKNFDFGYMADFLEKTNLPIIIIGVGAQTNDRTMASPIHPNTLRLMRLISDRSASIGVRGYYTAEVLAANGIHNVRVIGCPSIYTSRCPTVKVDSSRLESLTNISVNFSRRVYQHSFHPERLCAIENTLLKFALAHNSTFVAQDEVEELALYQGNESGNLQITKYFNQIDKSACIDFFRSKTRYFCNVSSWATYIRTQNASVGGRFHGNLIALTNGIPALSIVHDSRTMEMCTLLGSPTIHLSEVDEKDFTEQILTEQLHNCTFDQFEKSYSVLYKRFLEFITENGLPHNLVHTSITT